MSLDDLPRWAHDLIVSARVARLGLLDERDRPRVVPVTFAVHEGALWSAIDQKPKRSSEPARVRRLRRRPQATLLVDLYSDDWSRLAWIEASGRVSVLAVGDAPGAIEALTAKYDQYGSQAPPGPLLRLAPEHFAYWRAS